MDWNGDGNRDMLVGGFGGEVMYYAGKPDGKFAAGSELRFDNGEYFLHQPILSEVMKKQFPEPAQQSMLSKDDSAAGIWVTDWDGDGDLDIVSGWFFGGLFVSRNNGTPTAPKLSAEFEPVYAGGKPLREVFQSEPTIADWDGDGRNDLIFGTRKSLKTNDSAVYWCRNTADKGDPVYDAPRMLVDTGPESQLIAPSLGRNRALGSALTVTTIDWEGDGDLDLLLGDYATPQLTSDNITAKQFEELLALRVQAKEIETQYAAAEGEAKKVLRDKFKANRNAQQKYLMDTQATSKAKDKQQLGRVWLLIRD